MLDNRAFENYNIFKKTERGIFKMKGNRNKEEKKILLSKINDLLLKLSKKQLARIYELIKCIYIYG